MAILDLFKSRTTFGLKDIKPIYQGEISECGLASVAMLLQSLGHDVTLCDLRKRCSASLSGMSLADLVNVLSLYGVTADPVRFEQESLGELFLPAILHVGGNHYVVVMRAVNSLYHVFDPAVGERVVQASVLSGIATGYAVVPVEATQVRHINTSEKQVNYLAKLKSLAHHAGGYRLISLMVIGGGLSFITPLFVGISIDKLLGSAGIHEYWSAGLAFLFAAIGVFFFERFCGRLLLIKSANIGAIAYSNSFSRLIKNNLRYFSRRKPGELAERLLSYGRVSIERLQIYSTMFCSGVVALTSISAMAWLQPLLAVVSISGITITGVLTLRYASISQKLRLQSEQAAAEQQQFLLETIQGISAWKPVLAMRRRINSYLDHGHAVVQAWRCNRELELRQRTAYSLLGNLEFLIVLGVAASAMLAGQLTFGGFYSFAFLRQITLSSVSQVYDGWIAMRSMVVVDALAQDMFESSQNKTYYRDKKFQHSLLFELGYFQHEGGACALRGIHMEVQKGANIALLGDSGSGKTTLLMLLSGLEIPKSGSLKIDGCQVDDWTQIRDICYLHSAQDILFSGSIFDNITMFNPAASRNECWHWLEAVGLADRIREFPGGIDMHVSDATSPLSSGERQRLIVARTLFSGFQVGLFDEPTANLDEINARTVISAITSSPNAAIVVTHDKHNLDLFDAIYELRGGYLHPVSCAKWHGLERPVP